MASNLRNSKIFKRGNTFTSITERTQMRKYIFKIELISFFMVINAGENYSLDKMYGFLLDY